MIHPEGHAQAPFDRADNTARLALELAELRRWKAEATEVILGLQDLGKALGIPLGERITGPVAAKAAQDLRAENEALRLELGDWINDQADKVARLADAEAEIARLRGQRDELDDLIDEINAERADADSLGEALAREVARAEAAEDALRTLRERVAGLERLFAGGPDTPCRTTWRYDFAAHCEGYDGREECIEVPVADLRAALAETAPALPSSQTSEAGCSDAPAEATPPASGLNCPVCGSGETGDCVCGPRGRCICDDQPVAREVVCTLHPNAHLSTPPAEQRAEP